ncbi:sensor histidine kinase [Williamsia muralis]|uniref:Histidine kinase n=1 Tax=Williamsia marianensis TaxID=85044 RepID=A0A2G3PM01_WILMA|nr:sensor histidine kinase [Williamsia marianensis]PHV66857.1 histidine kinase [Williamsia marianensis]
MSAISGRFTAWRDLRWAFAAVWLFFLAYPVLTVIRSNTMSTAERVYTLVLLGGFAVGYLLTCVYVLFGTSRHSNRRRAAPVAFVALAVVAAATTVTLDQEVFALAPYLMAVAALSFAIPAAVAIFVFLTGSAVVMPEIVDGWELDTGVVVMLLVVGPTVLAVRILRAREELREESEAVKRGLDEQLAIVAERERVARDVHDILGHSLTVMTVKSELAGRLMDVDPTAARAELADLHRISREALAEVRTTVGGLRSPDLATELLAADTALTATRIAADLPGDATVAAPENRVLFAWVLREAITNVVRHSGATTCRVRLQPNAIDIVDDGVGLDGSVSGNGLRGLRERVQAAGGTLTLGGDHGTELRVLVP